MSHSPPTTLTPLPPPPVDRRAGYAWAVGLNAGVWAILMVLVGFQWITLPGFDPTAGIVWWLVSALVVLTPFCLLLATASCGLVALFRKFGARKWPPIMQALPAVLIVLGVTYGLLYVLWTSGENI